MNRGAADTVADRRGRVIDGFGPRRREPLDRQQGLIWRQQR